MKICYNVDMNEYIIDARLLHSWTLRYLSEGDFKQLICVSEKEILDDLKKLLIKNLKDSDLKCIFCRAKDLKIEEDNTLVVFESFSSLKNCLNDDINEITVVFVSTWGKPSKYYGEGLYLSPQDEEIIADLSKSNRELFYQPRIGRAKRYLSEIMEERNAG